MDLKNQIIVTCPECGNEFEFIEPISGLDFYWFRDVIIPKILNKEPIILCCENCIKSKNSGLCSVCGVFNYYRDGSRRGRDSYIIPTHGCNCSAKWYKEHNSSDKMKEASKNNAIKYLVPITKRFHEKGFCTICGVLNEERDHNGRVKTNCDCSYIQYSKIGKKRAEKMSEPGICLKCGYNTRKDNALRTSAGLCKQCQAKITKEI